ncbi:MAG: SDR family oxidoreductase [Actinobacteria bacterium]|nr:SDR family oxidoreductase [Actinomycetota bacterium]
MDLQGKHVVVIGGSSGMGLATAAGAAAAGAKVTIASSDQSRLDAALATLPSGCDGVVVDARREESFAEALAQIGELDHLVYSAGDGVSPRPLVETAPDEARGLFDVRFWGAVAAIRHAAPRIKAGGSIGLTSGTIVVRPPAGAALAAGAAAAIEGLTRGLAVELAPVRVNAVRPGAIHTPMWDALPEARRSAVLGALAERTITKKVGQPDEIAAAHLFLMDNRFVTGTVLTVDGGAILI